MQQENDRAIVGAAVAEDQTNRFSAGSIDTYGEQFDRAIGGLNDRRTSLYRLKIVGAMEDRCAADVTQIELRIEWYRIKELLGIDRRNGGPGW